MMEQDKIPGFNKLEGILALLGYCGAFIVTIIGLRKKPLYLVSFLALIGLFHTIYALRLCPVCEKLCPINPTGNFWKTWFKSQKL
jgi:hypothetical protein